MHGLEAERQLVRCLIAALERRTSIGTDSESTPLAGAGGGAVVNSTSLTSGSATNIPSRRPTNVLADCFNDLLTKPTVVTVCSATDYLKLKVSDIL